MAIGIQNEEFGVWNAYQESAAQSSSELRAEPHRAMKELQNMESGARMPNSRFSILNFAIVLMCAVLVPRAGADERDAGKVVFARVCESCHGPGASGGQGPALVPFKKDLAELVAIVRLGVGLMPALPRAEITDAEIAQVHAYLKSLGEQQHEESVVAQPATLPRPARGDGGSNRIPGRAAARADAGLRAPAGH
jgi:mono/diheme cytochrome c family protein